jgi:hypothetical protein
MLRKNTRLASISKTQKLLKKNEKNKRRIKKKESIFLINGYFLFIIYSNIFFQNNLFNLPQF